jgi:hypothetical protein
MSEYLKRLKAVKFENMLGLAPSKPSKGAFEGFEGSCSGVFSKNNLNLYVKEFWCRVCCAASSR